MRKLLIRFAPVILLAAVVIFTMMGIREVKAQNTFEKTTAVITNIEREYVGGEKDYEYHVFVRYSAGGTEYESMLDSYSSSMKVGKELKAVYNPEDPYEVKAAGYFASVMCFVMAAIALFAAVSTIIKKLNGRM